VNLSSSDASTVASLLRIASVPAVGGAIAKSFEWSESALSAKGKGVIATWLRNAPPESEFDIWPNALAHLIDRVFGTRAISRRFITRSCLASLLAMTLLLLLLLLVGGREAVTGAFTDGSPNVEQLFGFLFFLAPSGVVNLAADYFSLLVSRAVIRSMAVNKSSRKTAALLVLDLALSFVFATLGIFLGSVLLHKLFDPDPGVWSEALGAMRNFFRGLDSHGKLSPWHIPFYSDARWPYGIFFYSAFLTSVWVWLYVVGGLVIKALKNMFKGWTRLTPFLDLETKPLTAIGRVAAVLVGFAYAIIIAVLAFVRH